MSNKTPNSDENSGHNKIDSLYQQLAQENPSQQHDQAILGLASSHLKHQHTTSKITQSQWRKWQWPTSIAASVMFVSLIVYTQYEQFDPQQALPSSLPVDPYTIAQQSTLDEVAARQRATLETKAQKSHLGERERRKAYSTAPELDDAISQEISEPAISDYAELEAQSLASTALDDVQIDIDIDEFNPDELVKIDTGLESKRASHKDLITTLSPATAASEMITVSGSRIGSETQRQIPIESDYLQDLLQKLTKLNKQPNMSETERGTAHDLQQSIFDYLSLLKMADPNIIVDQKYLSVLSKQQQEKL